MSNSQNYGVGGNVSPRRMKRRNDERKSGWIKTAKREDSEFRQINMKIRFYTGYDCSGGIKRYHSSHFSLFLGI